MLKIALRDYVKYFPKILCIIISFAIGVSVFSLTLFLGVYLPLNNADPNTASSFFSYFFDAITNTNLTELLTPDTLENIMIGLSDTLSGVPESLSKITIWVFIIGFLLVLISREVGTMLTKMSMREDASNRNSKKGIPAFLIRTLFSLAFWAISLVVIYYWIFAIVLIPFVYIFISSIQDLITTWMINFKQYRLKDILNFKNFVKLSFVYMFTKLINYLLIFFLLAITNFLVAIIIALPILAYDSCSTTVTSTNYFNEQISKRKLQKAK